VFVTFPPIHSSVAPFVVQRAAENKNLHFRFSRINALRPENRELKLPKIISDNHNNWPEIRSDKNQIDFNFACIYHPDITGKKPVQDGRARLNSPMTAADFWA
jgi:hypothetical protein